ncbi:MAG: hypothetical protein ACJ8F2_11000 [Xanthobacteraceae bacterium]
MTSSAFLSDPDASRIMAGSLAAMFLGSKARMAEEVRAKAKALLDPVLRKVPILSTDKSDGGLYAKYTGYTQEYLEEWWDVKKRALTGCNPFVGWYSGNLLGNNLGGFQLDTILKGLGKLHTWVKSSSGYEPGYGDICLHTGRGHMSICLGIGGGRRKAVQGAWAVPACAMTRSTRVTTRGTPLPSRAGSTSSRTGRKRTTCLTGCRAGGR